MWRQWAALALLPAPRRDPTFAPYFSPEWMSLLEVGASGMSKARFGPCCGAGGLVEALGTTRLWSQGAGVPPMVRVSQRAGSRRLLSYLKCIEKAGES